ncbi:hypothetical protein LOK49_LG04G02111 [Camellia lanceoleosa]|uniref:Uncharacterized protein n=1 Tax=Camellia lanceoleosa TaxID=1840588 RepID=A0ACC0HWI2_9ERIC|nr:hypothetical protein LOK49_LG04G02111 [Camellia lanceoleosa]
MLFPLCAPGGGTWKQFKGFVGTITGSRKQRKCRFGVGSWQEKTYLNLVGIIFPDSVFVCGAFCLRLVK